MRQHVLNYLVVEKKFSASSIAVEKELLLNDLKKRYDIVVYKRDLSPYLIIECKAPYVDLSPSVVEQALRYNLIVKAELLMISNGISELVFNSSREPAEIPLQSSDPAHH